MTTPAAIAVIRATIEDAHLAEILTRPGMTAHRVARALETHGWTITPTPARSGPYAGTQHH
ncbi:hypothetical protein ACIBAC_15065 [Streptomyces sp. NPDC051362]|uniref:hypothetical protein n=1 Tax=Streptomyces sp. NPDC051362 TaxID=3365651 RepID=UPI00379F9799